MRFRCHVDGDRSTGQAELLGLGLAKLLSEPKNTAELSHNIPAPGTRGGTMR